MDEVMIHGVGQGAQLARIPAVLAGLDIGISQGVGDLGGEASLHGGPAYQGSKDDHAGLCLAEGILSPDRNAGA